MNFFNVKLKKDEIHIESENNETSELLSVVTSKKETKIKLPKQYSKLLKDYDGKELVMGIRPEDVYIKGDKNNEAPSEPIKANCDFAELLGYELVLYSYISGQRLIAKTSTKFPVKTGDDFEVCFDEKKLFFFDKESTLRIRENKK